MSADSFSYVYNNIIIFLFFWCRKVGFDELGGKDDFSTEDLEERLAKSEVIIFLDGEGSAFTAKQAAASKRSVRQSDTGNSSDSE